MRLRSLQELHVIACGVRQAILSIPTNERPITLSKFPRGACGDSVLLLGAYLIELEEEPFDYMLGKTTQNHNDPDWSSHVWMQRGNLVIDITADQFPAMSEEVIVSVDSDWHHSLKGTAEHVADFHVYEHNTMTPLTGSYNRIKEIVGAA